MNTLLQLVLGGTAGYSLVRFFLHPEESLSSNPPRDQEMKRLYRHALAVYQPGTQVGPLARELGVDKRTIIRWMTEAGVYKPPPTGRPRTAPYTKALSMYEPGMNVAALARELRVPYIKLLNFLKADGVYVSTEEIRDLEERRRAAQILGSPKTRKEIILTTATGMTLDDIAIKYGTFASVIREVLEDEGVEVGKSGIVDPEHSISKELAKRQWSAKMGGRKAARTRTRSR